MTHPVPPDRSHPYRQERFALLTLHNKALAIAPPLQQALDVRLIVDDAFDTDALGTFCRGVPRAGTQLEAARRKAHLAVERSGVPVGLGSEGSFGPGPFGIGVWNLELIVAWDALRELEVVGWARAAGRHHHTQVRSLEELRAFAAAAAAGAHALVLRPDDDSGLPVRKGLRTDDEWTDAYLELASLAKTGVVWVENDLRAHVHPSRMETIALAAADLTVRLAALCPACGVPGFGWSRSVSGLPCSACGEPTRLPIADEHACVKCAFVQLRPHPSGGLASPARCDYCNP